MENIQLYYPQFLFMFAVPLIWLMYLFLTKKHKSQAIFSEEVLKKIVNPSGGLSIKTRTVLTFISLFFAIIALARPVIPDGEIEIESKQVDVVFALDISKSMLAKDMYPNRLEFAKQKILTLIKNSKNNRIGVIAFANGSYIVSPLTFDKEAVKYLVHNLNTLNITEQGTSIKSLLASAKEFLRDHKEKILVIFTDGGDKDDYSEEIKIALDEEIKILVVGIGTEKGSPIETENGTFLKHNDSIVISKINENIKNLALATNGIFIKSTNSLEDINTVLAEVNSLTANETKKQTIPIFIELFYYPLSVSILFLIPIFFSFPRFGKKNRTYRMVSKNRMNHFIFLFFVIIFSASFNKLEAGFFDFLTIQDAEENYKNSNFEDSTKLYKELLRSNNSDEVKYNLANSFYKSQNYSSALKLYEELAKSKNKNIDFNQQVYHNLGNTQVAMNKLQESIESYKKSLEFKYSKTTDENLKWAEEQLKKQEQQEKNQEQNSNQNKNQDGEEKDKNQESQQDKNQDSENNENNKNQQNEDKVDKNDKKNSEDSDNKKNGESDSKNQPEKSNDNGDQKDKKEEEQKSKFTKTKEEQLSDKDLDQNTTMIQAQDPHISDREEEKLLELLQNLKANTKIYTIVPPQKEADLDVKPW
jgi:Ca-activated chloride channel family protein